MPGPLTGLKVLDFTTLLPGPFATMMLADLGAEVLRIVSGTRIDLTTLLPPFVGRENISAILAYLGRGKQSMTLNLKDPRAVKIVHQLLGDYDIVIEQFRPGVMGKFGLDYAQLQKVKPALIYCSLTGYGQTGPLADRAGHDINYLARSGLMAYSGPKDKGPVLTGMQIADIAAGSNNSVIGILAAVVHRQRTGEGQYIDVAMTDGVMAFNAMVGAAYLADGQEMPREGHMLNGGSLYDFYETQDGQYVSFGGLEPQFFAAFCMAIERPDLIPGQVMTTDLPGIKAEVREIIRSKTREEWLAIFKDYDACLEPVLSLSEALTDPQTADRGLVVDVPLPAGGTVKQLACPIRFSTARPQYDRSGVFAGTHTVAVLKGLGYTEDEIGEFKKTGLFQ
ncbi:MAG: CoA transferase [Desulfobacterota bacterium]|jgi:crotonobetainyl-CoA:carnitine CoA-transferase CaiB-like acyl-CoA transferase|nr:CoA transferase [Thermodesulfobacteriota bacterium]